MRLHRIRLSEFRRFAQPLVIDGLEPGINLFVGPNEAGKSTVATAIRAAFLERYKTSKVTDFAPYGASAAQPSVELVFDSGGQRYTLRKSFLTRPRCELVLEDGQRLDGDRAEDTLAGLLGYALSGKGQSRPEHAGVPGLLWIQQGESAHRAPIQHAQEHLRDALQRVSGELASGEGDRLLARVEADLAELLDARGKPRGVLRETEETLVRVRAELESLQASRRELEQAIEQLAGLRLAHAEDERDPPWVGFERQAAQARERDQAAALHRRELDVLLRERRQHDEQIGLLQEGVMHVHRELEELAALRRELHRLDEASDAHAAMADGDEQALARERERVAQVRSRYEAARQLAERRDVQSMVERQQAETQRLQDAWRQARALAAGLAELRVQARSSAIDDAALAALRELEREREGLALRRAAVATRLRYRLAHGGALALDGEALAGSGERWLEREAVLVLPDGGRLEIQPGGQDLAQLMAQSAALDERRVKLLATLGADSLAQAEARWGSAQACAREMQARERELDIHAPRGLAELKQSCAEGQALLERLHLRLAQFPPMPEGAALPDVAVCRTELELAETALRQTEERGAARRLQAHQARLALLQAREREQALAERLEGEAARSAHAQRTLQLVQARAQRDGTDRRIDEAKARLGSYDAQLCRQDIERFERSARIAREAFQARHERMLLLQGRLDEAGARGLGERLAEAQADAERLQRRLDGLRLRAQALVLLRDLLRAQRDAATARLQAPLAARLAHYLKLLFGEASLHLDDDLLPARMVRAEQALDVGLLSYGAQEQLGILARLAYADILQEAGRPTLLILDDALVHSDAQRLAWMKRALFDAAMRHQILVFTCHGSAWRDLGVAARSLEDL